MEELEKKVKQYVKEIDQILNEIEETKRGRNKLRLEIEDVKGQIQRKFIEQNTARMSVMQAEEKKRAYVESESSCWAPARAGACIWHGPVSVIFWEEV